MTGGTLDPHARELAILVACRETNYNLEWNGHEASGLKAGIDADVVRYNRPLDGVNERDAAVIRFGRQLFHDKRVHSATFAKAAGLWGERGVMDMVAVMNTYAVRGYFAIAVDERSPEDRSEFLRSSNLSGKFALEGDRFREDRKSCALKRRFPFTPL